MERTVTVTEANRAFSRIVREVAAGDSYVVTARGRPIIRLERIEADRSDEEGRRAKVRALVDELTALPLRAPGRIIRDDGYE